MQRICGYVCVELSTTISSLTVVSKQQQSITIQITCNGSSSNKRKLRRITQRALGTHAFTYLHNTYKLHLTINLGLVHERARVRLNRTQPISSVKSVRHSFSQSVCQCGFKPSICPAVSRLVGKIVTQFECVFVFESLDLLPHCVRLPHLVDMPMSILGSPSSKAVWQKFYRHS